MPTASGGAESAAALRRAGRPRRRCRVRSADRRSPAPRRQQDRTSPIRSRGPVRRRSPALSPARSVGNRAAAPRGCDIASAIISSFCARRAVSDEQQAHGQLPRCTRGPRVKPSPSASRPRSGRFRGEASRSAQGRALQARPARISGDRCAGEKRCGSTPIGMVLGAGHPLASRRSAANWRRSRCRTSARSRAGAARTSRTSGRWHRLTRLRQASDRHKRRADRRA